MKNPESNAMAHNVDFHAFQVRYPGFHIYHCAVRNLDYHSSAGMFGGILVEPEDGLPEVDHEFYLGQHEVYPQGGIDSDPHRNVQTTPVKPGSCVVANMRFPVPGGVKLVDHALSRVARKGVVSSAAGTAPGREPGCNSVTPGRSGRWSSPCARPRRSPRRTAPRRHRRRRPPRWPGAGRGTRR